MTHGKSPAVFFFRGPKWTSRVTVSGMLYMLYWWLATSGFRSPWICSTYRLLPPIGVTKPCKFKPRHFWPFIGLILYITPFMTIVGAHLAIMCIFSWICLLDADGKSDSNHGFDGDFHPLGCPAGSDRFRNVRNTWVTLTIQTPP